MDWLTVLILAWVCVAIGYFGANLIDNFRNRKKVEQDPPEVPEEIPLGRTEIIRLWRPDEGGRVLPEIDGELISTPGLLSAEQHAKISLAMVDLYAWMEDGNYPLPKGAAVESESPDSRPEQPTTSPSPMPSSELGNPAPAGDVEIEPAKMNFIKSLVHTARNEANRKIAPEDKSIAEQVDSILQSKIDGTALEDRAIRLLDLPNQGMVIFIGLDKYQDIEEVPDEEIREVLRASAAEWEEQMLRGSKT